MTKYVLECPQCLARFNLRRHVPGRRVRCRKCRTVVMIPDVSGGPPAAEAAAEKPLPPDLRRKLVRALSLPRLALVALLLTASLVGAAVALVRKRGEMGAAPPGPPPEPPRLTLDRLAAANRLLAFPLGRGFAWEYALEGGGTEERRVVLLSRGLEDEPLADLGITGSLETGRLTFRVSADGVYLLSEVRGEARHRFSPPLRVVPHPLYLGDAWEYRGARLREGGGAEEWDLKFSALDRPEVVDSGMGRQTCFRVEVQGTRGTRRLEETLWYAKGVGLVKRLTREDGRREEALLLKFAQE